MFSNGPVNLEKLKRIAAAALQLAVGAMTFGCATLERPPIVPRPSELAWLSEERGKCEASGQQITLVRAITYYRTADLSLLDWGRWHPLMDRNDWYTVHEELRACRDYFRNLTFDLIRRGADIEARAERGVTALHWAVFDPVLVVLLLDKGVKVDVQTVDGKTPLHRALSEGSTSFEKSWIARHFTSAQLLLRAGADPNIKDSEGKTPYERIQPEVMLVYETILDLRTKMGVDLRVPAK